MNKKGFTLVELLAVLVILGLIVSIGGVAITKIMSNTKEKNYETLIANIKSGVETFYQECKYGDVPLNPNADPDTQLYYKCLKDINASGYYKVKVSTLVNFGYVSSNFSEGNVNKLVNPKDEKIDFSNCNILYKYDDNKNKLIVTTSYTSDDGGCPKETDFGD